MRHPLTYQELAYIDEIAAILRSTYIKYFEVIPDRGNAIEHLRDKIIHEEVLAQREAEEWLRKQDLPSFSLISSFWLSFFIFSKMEKRSEEERMKHHELCEGEVSCPTTGKEECGRELNWKVSTRGMICVTVFCFGCKEPHGVVPA